MITITPDGRTAYVGNGFGLVTPIRTATNTALKPIDLGYGNQIDSIAITPNGKTAYVGTIAGTVVPIRVATNKPGQPIHAGDNPSTSSSAER